MCKRSTLRRRAEGAFCVVRMDARALIVLADFFHVSIDYPVGRTELPSMDAKRISNELSKVQLQLEKIKIDLQK